MTASRLLSGMAVLLAGALTFTACAGRGGDEVDRPGAPQTDPAVRALLPEEFVRRGTFRVALFENAPPDAYKENGKVVGWQAELAEAVGDVFGVPTEIVPAATFDSLIPGLVAGRFDAAFSSFYITDERLQVADFASVGVVGTGYGVAKGSGIAIAEPGDLCGHVVATLAGSTFVTQLEAISETCADKGGLEVLSYPNNSDGVLAITTGRAEIFATSSNEMAALADQSDGALVVQPLIYEPTVLAEAFVKGSPLAPATSAALNSLIASGRYAEILEKYGVAAAAIDKSEVNPTT